MRFLVISLILTSLRIDVYSQWGTISLPYGTTILGFISKDTIWLGADSRVGNNINGVDKGFQTKCKIEESNNVFIAMSGYPSFIYEKDTIFNAYAEVKKELKADTSIIEACRKLYVTLYQEMNDYLSQVIKVRADTGVRQFFNPPRKIILQVTVSGFNRRNKVVHGNWLYYMTGTPANWKLEPAQIMLIDGDINDLGTTTLFSMAGEQDSLTKFVKGPNQIHILPKMSRKDRIKYLIGLEIAKNKNVVGPPVNVVQITAKGHKWLTHHNTCKLEGGY